MKDALYFVTVKAIDLMQQIRVSRRVIAAILPRSKPAKQGRESICFETEIMLNRTKGRE